MRNSFGAKLFFWLQSIKEVSENPDMFLICCRTYWANPESSPQIRRGTVTPHAGGDQTIKKGKRNQVLPDQQENTNWTGDVTQKNRAQLNFNAIELGCIEIE